MTYQTTLSDAQYARLERLPPPGNHLKIPRRQVLDAWLYVNYQACASRGLAREFGNWHTNYMRLNRWAKAGVLERVMQAKQQELLVESDAGTLSLDSAIIHLHMHGTGAPRKGAPPVQARGRQAIGRSRGGLTTKLHALVASDRIPLIIGLSPGQRHDAPWGRELLCSLGPASSRPYLLMDRAYEDDATRRVALDLGYQPVVPPKSNRRRPHDYDREVYSHRNEVERFYRIDSRCDTLDIVFLAAIHLVLIYDILNSM